MRFSYPPTINTGDVLCKVQLDAFRLNDEYFNGLADGWRPIHAGVGRGFIGTETQLTVYDARHLLRDDAKTLCYYIFADQGSGTNTVTLKLYYDEALIDSVSSTGSFQYKDTTYSLSAKSAGFYRCHAVLERTDGNQGGSGGLRAPYTRYTGSRSYSTPPTIADDGVSAAAHFQAWRDNDLYFLDQVRPNAAFVGLAGGWTAQELSKVVWTGWDRFHPDHYRMYYRVYLSSVAGGNTLTLYYDYGGSNEQSKAFTTTGWHEGYWELSSPENYTKGGYYKVVAKMTRTDQYEPAGCQVYYLFMGAPAADSGYTTMGQFSAGQYVYGNTGGQSTRLSLLSDNDGAIRDRLIWADEATGRQDYCVPDPCWPVLGGTETGYYAAVRRFDLLYYRAKEAELKWGEETQRLEDYDDTAGDAYRVLNLNSLGIPRGQVYTIEVDSESEDAELMFAMEF